MIDIQIGSVSFFESSVDIWFISSSIFGIWGRFFMQLSLSLRESSAIFTDLSCFTVMTTGETKQSSSIVSNRSRCPDFISRSSSFFTSFCRWYGIGLAFCWIG